MGLKIIDQAYYTRSSSSFDFSYAGIGTVAASRTDNSFINKVKGVCSKFSDEGEKAARKTVFYQYEEGFDLFVGVGIIPAESVGISDATRNNILVHLCVPKESSDDPKDYILDYPFFCDENVSTYHQETLDTLSVEENCADVVAALEHCFPPDDENSEGSMAALLSAVYDIFTGRGGKFITIIDQNGSQLFEEKLARCLMIFLLRLLPEAEADLNFYRKKLSFGVNAIENKKKVKIAFCGNDSDDGRLHFYLGKKNSYVDSAEGFFDLLARKVFLDVSHKDNAFTGSRQFIREVFKGCNDRSINNWRLKICFLNWRMENEVDIPSNETSTTYFNVVCGEKDTLLYKKYSLNMLRRVKNLKISVLLRVFYDVLLPKLLNNNEPDVNAEGDDSFADTAICIAKVWETGDQETYHKMLRVIQDPKLKQVRNHVLDALKKREESPILGDLNGLREQLKGKYGKIDETHKWVLDYLDIYSSVYNVETVSKLLAERRGSSIGIIGEQVNSNESSGESDIDSAFADIINDVYPEEDKAIDDFEAGLREKNIDWYKCAAVTVIAELNKFNASDGDEIRWKDIEERAEKLIPLLDKAGDKAEKDSITTLIKKGRIRSADLREVCGFIMQKGYISAEEKFEYAESLCKGVKNYDWKNSFANDYGSADRLLVTVVTCLNGEVFHVLRGKNDELLKGAYADCWAAAREADQSSDKAHYRNRLVFQIEREKTFGDTQYISWQKVTAKDCNIWKDLSLNIKDKDSCLQEFESLRSSVFERNTPNVQAIIRDHLLSNDDKLFNSLENIEKFYNASFLMYVNIRDPYMRYFKKGFERAERIISEERLEKSQYMDVLDALFAEVKKMMKGISTSGTLDQCCNILVLIGDPEKYGEIPDGWLNQLTKNRECYKGIGIIFRSVEIVRKAEAESLSQGDIESYRKKVKSSGEPCKEVKDAFGFWREKAEAAIKEAEAAIEKAKPINKTMASVTLPEEHGKHVPSTSYSSDVPNTGVEAKNSGSNNSNDIDNKTVEEKAESGKPPATVNSDIRSSAAPNPGIVGSGGRSDGNMKKTGMNMNSGNSRHSDMGPAVPVIQKADNKTQPDKRGPVKIFPDGFWL